MREVTVGKLAFGIGRMKICVPVCAETAEEAVREIAAVRSSPADLIEWRLDHFREDIPAAAPAVFAAAGDLPVLCTFRTAREGGQRTADPETYFSLNRALGEAGAALVDLELEMCRENETAALDTVRALQRAGVRVVVSFHDFEKTPPRSELLERFRMMRETFGADLPKIAVMPKTQRDVMVLLSAMTEASPLYGPLIGISMGELGKMTRVHGGTFGSVLTFATVGKASAPGQFSAAELAALLAPGGHHAHGHAHGGAD